MHIYLLPLNGSDAVTGMGLTVLAFPFVLSFSVSYGLPLHIGRRVWAATRQRVDVVNDPTSAGHMVIVV
jgi:hypothetical protein